jgi:hypothetical protein
MNICDCIDDFKSSAGDMAAEYVHAATFGNETPEQFYKLLAVNSMIRTLERQVTGKRIERVKVSLQGQVVSLSSLKSDGNKLFLDTQKYKCLTTDIRPCLSESQICSIIEKLELFCN